MPSTDEIVRVGIKAGKLGIRICWSKVNQAWVLTCGNDLLGVKQTLIDVEAYLDRKLEGSTC